MLETRLAPAIDIVTSLGDNGAAGTLRNVIAGAASGDTIQFAVSGTINLNSQISIGQNLTINGANQISINGNLATRLFLINAANVNVNFNGLTFMNGANASYGAAIDNIGGNVAVTNSTFISNHVTGTNGANGVSSNGKNPGAGGGGGGGAGLGGAIYSSGTLIVTGSAFMNNGAQGGSGGSGAFPPANVFNATGGQGGDGGGVGGAPSLGGGNGNGSGQGGGGGGGSQNTGGNGGNGSFGGGGGGGGGKTGGGQGGTGGTGGANAGSGGTATSSGSGGGGGGAGLGGAIFNDGGTAYIATSTFSGDSTAGGAGGGGTNVGTAATNGLAPDYGNNGGTNYFLVVLNTNDSGFGSLRQAITNANINASNKFYTATNDIISFDIGTLGSAQTITLANNNPLPVITDPKLAINGWTQSSGVNLTTTLSAPLVTIDGTNVNNNQFGLNIQASNTTISGLQIQNFSSGGGNDSGIGIFNNVTGTTLLGNFLLSNGNLGVWALTGSNTTIGGAADPNFRNVISGNGSNGIELDTNNNLVIGNIIGLNATATATNANGGDGIRVTGKNNTIGGTSLAQRNTISGNTQNGVDLNGANATGNVVLGNIIGGTNLGNGTNGVLIQSASANTIGSTAAGGANYIGGNVFSGVNIFSAANNAVIGNFIGVGTDGTTPVKNTGAGVIIQSGATGNSIGGTAVGQPNTIDNNTTDGVMVNGATTINNPILGNSIFLNVNSGINLVSSGNKNRVAPTLIYSLDNGTNTIIAGTLASVASTTFRIEFFANTSAGPGNKGEGQTFIGFANVTTDASGNASFTATFPDAKAPPGTFISATATDSANNTSPFSTDVTTTGAAVSFTVTTPTPTTTAGTPISVTVTAFDASNRKVTGYSGTVTFTSSDSTATLPGNYTFNPSVDLGSHSFNVTFKKAGVQTLTATDTAISTLTGTLTETVQAPTTTLVTSSLNPSFVGNTVTFSATVSSTAGTPTGTVDFKDTTTGNDLGTVPLTNGSASIQTGSLNAGSHVITVSFTDPSNIFKPSSGSVTQTVFADPTTTALVATPTSGVSGQTFAFNVTVSSSVTGAGQPDGSVKFYIDTTPAVGPVTSTVTLSGGIASYVTPLAAGNHTVVAVYAPGANSNFSASQSVTAVIAVSKADTTTTLASSPNPATLGQSVTLTATIGVTLPGVGSPNGDTVTFFANGVSLGNGTIVGNTATLSTTALAGGANSITATFNGDTQLNTSTSAPVTETVTKAGSTTTITSPATGSSFAVGQPITITASVTGTGTPTGTIQFMDGSTALGGPVTIAAGTASLTTTTLASGSHAITAVYSGDNSFTTSTSSPVSLNVGQASSTTTVTSPATGASFVAGAAVTFKATVTSTFGTPTGTVQFMDGSTPLSGPATISAGTASVTTTTLSVGLHAITAVYSGNASIGGSTSAPVSVTIVVAPISSTTLLESSLNPSAFGQSVTFTATVIAADTSNPVGTVTFTELQGGVPVTLSTAVVNGGKATFTTSNLSAGAHNIFASFSGVGAYTNSISSILVDTVNAAVTSTTIVSSVTPSFIGESVAFTATVVAKAPGVGTPTGSVSFFIDGSVTPAATVTVASDGTATFTTSTLAVGSHQISATYTPNNTNFTASSTGVPALQVVNKADTSTTLASSPNPSSNGDLVTIKATVSPPAGISIGMTGTVMFLVDGAVIDTETIPAGTPAGPVTVSTSTSTLALGAHQLTAIFSGDSNFNTSTSPALTQTVNGIAATLSMMSSINPSDFGVPITLTATIATTSARTPTGTITFKEGTTVLGTVTVDANKQGTLTITAPTVGSHNYTANYSGDAFFAPSTITILQTVNQTATTTTLTAPSSGIVGQSVTFKATIAPVDGTGSPTGTVTFLDNGTAIGTGTISNGVATFMTTSLAKGSHSITAMYGGDSNFTASQTSAASTTLITTIPLLFNRT